MSNFLKIGMPNPVAQNIALGYYDYEVTITISGMLNLARYLHRCIRSDRYDTSRQHYVILHTLQTLTVSKRDGGTQHKRPPLGHLFPFIYYCIE